jgi:predicted acyltransferase
MTDSDENPWLVALGAIGILGTLAGIVTVLVGYNQQTLFDDKAGMISAGLGIAALGVTALVGWLVAGAVCWQLRRR